MRSLKAALTEGVVLLDQYRVSGSPRHLDLSNSATAMRGRIQVLP